MKILEIRALRGPNYYSRYPVIYMELDIGELEERPSDKVEGIAGRLESLIPTLKGHRCSRGYEGGFLERVNEGTWAGHIAEHVAIELQCMAKLEVGFGKTLDTDETGIYKVVFRYRDEAVGLAAGEFAVEIVSALFEGQDVEVAPMVLRLKEIREEHQLGPSTRSIVDEAKKRGIPMIRLNDDSYIQLGYGINQRRIQATMTDATSAIAVEIADDKMLTKEILEREGVPVPEGGVAHPKKAMELASEIGFPVVVKPLIGNHGRGISVNITSEEELKMAIASARKIHDKVIIERYIEGIDHRILVINKKFVAAARREPTPIIGDGTSTIRELIKKINEDPRRGIGHEKVLTRLEVDYMTKRLLELRKMSLDTVLEKGKRITIKSTANLSMGGTSVDVTDEVHPVVRAMAERVARIVNMDIMGIDVIANDLLTPLKPGEAGVVEINAAPGFRMHIKPYEGRSRNVARPVLDMLFPPGSKHTIPIITVTGTNGKTTTVRLISHILKYCGKNVGTACTDGIIIENQVIFEGDYSGPQGATTVLKDKTVDHAVLEVARGGLLRRGLTVDESDVGVILNVANDHLGEGGITTLEELAELKSIIADTVKPDGHTVLNADDPLVLKMKENLKSNCILFSLDPENPALASHIETGGVAANPIAYCSRSTRRTPPLPATSRPEVSR
jgi:cyanophycin synthetase